MADQLDIVHRGRLDIHRGGLLGKSFPRVPGRLVGRGDRREARDVKVRIYHVVVDVRALGRPGFCDRPVVDLERAGGCQVPEQSTR